MQRVHVIIEVGRFILTELFNVINVNFSFTGEKLAFSTELVDVDYHYERIKL